jgi:malonyl-CoA O-methyltransferase
MIDKQLVTKRFTRAIETYNREATAQRTIAGRLSQLVSQHVSIPPYPRVLEIGCGTGFLTRHLVHDLPSAAFTVNDLCPEMAVCFDDLTATRPVTFLGGDAEQIALPRGQHLIVSSSALQWFVQPARFFARCHQLLEEEGYLAFSTFGPDNLQEVSALTGASLAYRTLAEWQTLLAPHYQVVDACEEHLTLTFATPLDVLYHLKRTGVTAVQPTHAWTRGDLAAFAPVYAERYSQEGGGVRLTYHPLYLIAKKI